MDWVLCAFALQSFEERRRRKPLVSRVSIFWRRCSASGLVARSVSNNAMLTFVSAVLGFLTKLRHSAVPENPAFPHTVPWQPQSHGILVPRDSPLRRKNTGRTCFKVSFGGIGPRFLCDAALSRLQAINLAC
jgi:hypothetical protein